MPLIDPLSFSQQLLLSLGIKVRYHYRYPYLPSSGMVVVSNHRSILDAPILMAAANRPVRFACHRYMSQVPILNEIVTGLGCFPLDSTTNLRRRFFQQAVQLLEHQQAVGIFPEGAQPMVNLTPPQETAHFHRGFAHLALRAPVDGLHILPVAIASRQELTNSVFPLRMLSWFDPSEPLFDQSGWHPMVIYRRVDVVVGRPIAITDRQRQAYGGRQAKAVVNELTAHCRAEIDRLLHQGC
jgi:1-acyl-sn-glycerol-3-phosphate acyltransferase